MEASIMILLLTSLLIVSAGISEVSSQSVGIKVGDWVKYGVSGSLSAGGLSWMKIEVTDVEGTSITVNETTHAANGTEAVEPLVFVVGSSEGGIGGIGWIIPANSTVNDTVSFSGADILLTQESVRSYGGVSRTVVGLDISVAGTSVSIFWDKSTGILLETSENYSGESFGIVASQTSFSSNGASGGALGGLAWWIWAVIIVVIVGAIGAGLFMLRRKKPTTGAIPPQQLPPPPPPPPYINARCKKDSESGSAYVLIVARSISIQDKS